MLSTTRSLIRASKAIYPKPTPRALLNRARFIKAAIPHRDLALQVINAPQHTALAEMYAQRPGIVGVVVWPYICAAWDAKERLRHVIDHYTVIDQLGPPFPFLTLERLVLVELDAIHPQLRLVLDQPRWFLREGGLTLNLFVAQFRAYSIAYAYQNLPDGTRAIYIGSLQGRDTEDSMDIYRDLTKSLHGMRPRDFLLHALQTFAKETGVSQIYAVADEQRHHRHPYFGGKTITGDYNAIWEDRGGTRINAHFYQLPLIPERRDIDTIKSKKKNLYRKRYEFLDQFESQLATNLPRCTPVQFVDL